MHLKRLPLYTVKIIHCTTNSYMLPLLGEGAAGIRREILKRESIFLKINETREISYYVYIIVIQPLLFAIFKL